MSDNPAKFAQAFLPAGTLIEVGPPSVVPTETHPETGELLTPKLPDGMIAHRNGFLLPIERITVGDLVMGPDGNYQTVNALAEREELTARLVIKARHREIVVHPHAELLYGTTFLAERGFRPAFEFSVGHKIAIRCGSRRRDHRTGEVTVGEFIAPRTIESILIRPARLTKFYGLSCGPLNSFEAQGFFVGVPT